jgi:hypothetical protein
VTITEQTRPIVGSAVPRLWTPPLRELTPDTSYGFEVIDFAREIGHPLLPWQEFAVIHGGEMMDGPECAPALGHHAESCADPVTDGGCRPRFRILLLLVSRQNGKTELPVVLSIYWQFRKRIPLILGTSTKLPYAKESWLKAVNLVRRTPSLADQHLPGRKWFRMTNGETESFTNDGCRYVIAAANDEGGRSLTINRGIADELRQHRTYEAWEAMEPACSPWDAQLWTLSNAGDTRSIVLNDLQDSAREFIETGVGDPRLGLLEWSAPDDADPEDVDALLQANPRVGHGLDLDVLLAGAQRAKRLGGQALAGFKTERMCVRVRLLNAAVDPRRWADCLDPAELADLDRRRMAVCFEVSPDGDHATLGVGAIDDGELVRVETVDEWTGPRAAAELERALPGWIEVIRPRALGWLPSGPGAVVAAAMKSTRFPRGVQVEEIRGETPAVCMGFAKEVAAGTLRHSGQAMLDAQLADAEWQTVGGTRVFARKGGNVDAVYAVAGAAYLARTLPKPRVVSRRVHGAA